MTDSHMHDHGGPIARHGMLVVGEETVYLSHLPMFQDPEHPHLHDFQFILEATFTNGDDPQAAYVNDRRQTQTKVYTLRPEKFFLPDLIPTHTGHPPHRSSFRGNIHQGHFEKGGPLILEDVVVNVINVVHARQFDPDAQELPQLGYILFGKGHELFLAHLITKPPDFDQMLSIRITGDKFTDEELRHGIPMVVPERANSISERIRTGEQI